MNNQKVLRKKISDKIAIREAKKVIDGDRRAARIAAKKAEEGTYKTLSQKQLIILSWWLPGSPFENKDGIIADGAVRSGKTWAMSFSFIAWAMENFDEQDFILAGKTISALERNVVKSLLKMLRARGYRAVQKKSEQLIQVDGPHSSNTFYLFGGRDESSQDTIQGLTAAGAYFDEVALMPESFVNQATARCSVEGSKLWFNCNPEHPEHWFKLEWLEKLTEKNLIHLHFTMDDNPSLSDKKKAYYNKIYSGVFHDRMIKGLWRRASGIIYRKFADNPSAFVVNECKENLITINIGVDFGGTKSTTVFVATGFTTGFKTVYILDEKVIGEEIDPNALNGYFADFVRKVFEKYRKPMTVRCDSAEPVLIRGLANTVITNRLQCVIKNALKKPIHERIYAEQYLMGDFKLKILNHCKEIQSALLSAIWDDKHPDERLDEVGLHNPVDKLDAFEYSFEEYIPLLVDLTTIGKSK